MLMDLFLKYGTNQPIEWYEKQTHIPFSNCRRLLMKIKKGEDISVYSKRTGRKSKITGPFMRLIEAKINEEPTTSCNDLRLMLEVHDLFVAKCIVWRSLTHPIPEGSGKVYSFKKLINRSPTSDSEENKQIRYDRCKELDTYLKNGFDWVCVDETRFEVGYIQKYGWGEKGTRTVYRKKKRGFSGTAIIAISSQGFAYCQFVRGSVTSEVFVAFLIRLRQQFSDDSDIVIWLDNAPIHKAAMKVFPQDEKTKKMMIAQKKRWVPVIFNAAYSPELNPIENVLGVLKDAVETQITKFNSEEELIRLIVKAYVSLDRKIIRKSMERVRRIGFRLASKKEDLNDLRIRE